SVTGVQTCALPIYTTGTLLANGIVLVAGGWNGADYLASAELYNPATGTFTPTGSLNTASYVHTATLLNNGAVLITGGWGFSGPLADAELYNAPFVSLSEASLAFGTQNVGTTSVPQTVIVTNTGTANLTISTV